MRQKGVGGCQNRLKRRELDSAAGLSRFKNFTNLKHGDVVFVGLGVVLWVHVDFLDGSDLLETAVPDQ